MFKSIAVTGHTSGLGKGVYDYFQSLGYNVKGFSKDNGFDISLKENVDRIVELTRDCDLFFNNAYHFYQQVEIARLWQQQHWSDQHYIINTSSIAAEPLADIPNNAAWLKSYGDEKYSLNKISWEINHSGSKCKSMIIMPGVCQTNFYNPYDTPDQNGLELYQRVLETNSIITVNDFVNTVKLLLQGINERNFISSITILNGY
jgi:NADP-dependent 3-hydroxy acid dehydrogenase YdfG